VTANAAYQYIGIQDRGPARLVSINRPDKANALSVDLLTELEAALDAAEGEQDVRAVILTGNDRVFSAGADLNESITATGIFESIRYLRKLQSVTRCIEGLLKPVVAAVRGHCMTGGLEVALACDLRIAGSGARFAITSARIGSVAGLGGTQRLPRIVGASRAKDILLTGRTVDAAEAGAIGLVDEVVADASVLDRALAWVDEVATRAPLSVGLSKLAVNAGGSAGMDSALSLEAVLSTLAAGTADRQEGISAFLEKRQPVFRGA
jgi:enoyl-CoA hydratase/carnithine racemase